MSFVPLRAPPRIKVLEALGAVAGKRVKIKDEKNCYVDASEGPRTYRVFVDLSNQIAQSDDNGTVFRDYVGYPIIAFLMALGKISYNEKIANHIAAIKWRSLNEQYKSYAKVESVIKKLLSQHGIKPEEVDEFVAKVLQEVEQLGLRKQVI
ncbi:MAG: hypothetical protein RMI43_07255 [Candidatus Caldarchaeum sp.]|nr:hypothetical protein [Candidatus Caldarchaeum sp.]MCS7134073.1 hypothetical protein [Candidatus Caldarchaeum sp.]MCX8201271.1 hypothetical protein [Candidatus Caldarchaeum sp.]MDW8063952.1 hypothetical protein [Candidatus Caldarchaeum sp.]MDW8435575.1 hypothetical protein [Candidatus Caldarchaeum sp.]